MRVAGLWDDQEEARFVADEIEAWQRQGGRLSQAAVLVRAGFQTRSFEERFIQLGMPYRVVGGPRFYERAEIRDAIAYLRVVCQPDDDLAFERIVNVPRRGIGDSTLRSLRAAARAAPDQPVPGRAGHVPRPTSCRHGRATPCTELLGHLRPLARRSCASGRRASWPRRMLDESATPRCGRPSARPTRPGRLENLKELVKAVQEFDTLPAFLEHVSLVMDNAATAEGDMVSIMTLHGAKGLEFDNVFLAGWEEGLFPNQRAIDEGGNKALEEERRLAYVGITRARRRLTISFAANRRVYNQWSSSVPSRFVDELPPEHIEHLHRNPATRPDLGTFLDDEPFTAAPDQPVPLAPGGARQADRGQGRDPAVAAAGPDRRRSSPATGSSTTSSATGRSSWSTATSSTSPSSIRVARRSSTASSSRPDDHAWPDPDLWRLSVDTIGPAMPEVPEALEDEALSVSLFEIEDEATADPLGWRIDLLFREPPDRRGRRARARAPAGARRRLERSRSSGCEPEDWARATELRLPPVTAGRFVVHGSHARDAAAAGAVAIEIDAGPRFRLGRARDHPGPASRAIDRLARRRRFRHVLDVGCGSGVLVDRRREMLAGAGCSRSTTIRSPSGSPGTMLRLNGVAEPCAGGARRRLCATRWSAAGVPST